MAGRRRLNYEEGTCFAVPLRQGGYGRGVVARMDRRGGVFGYFFGPRLDTLVAARADNLSPDKAVLVVKCGDLGLLNGEWKPIGKVLPWEREKWPMPPLIRVDESAGRAWISYYDEKTFKCVREEEVSPALAKKYLEDGSWGYGAVEIDLTELLA